MDVTFTVPVNEVTVLLLAGSNTTVALLSRAAAIANSKLRIWAGFLSAQS